MELIKRGVVMKKYTKQQIIDMLKRNCRYDVQFGDDGESLNGITLNILSDEEDYNMLCDLIEIPKEER